MTHSSPLPVEEILKQGDGLYYHAKEEFDAVSNDKASEQMLHDVVMHSENVLRDQGNHESANFSSEEAIKAHMNIGYAKLEIAALCEDNQKKYELTDESHHSYQTALKETTNHPAMTEKTRNALLSGIWFGIGCAKYTIGSREENSDERQEELLQESHNAFEKALHHEHESKHDEPRYLDLADIHYGIAYTSLDLFEKKSDREQMTSANDHTKKAIECAQEDIKRIESHDNPNKHVLAVRYHTLGRLHDCRSYVADDPRERGQFKQESVESYKKSIDLQTQHKTANGLQQYNFLLQCYEHISLPLVGITIHPSLDGEAKKQAAQDQYDASQQAIKHESERAEYVGNTRHDHLVEYYKESGNAQRMLTTYNNDAESLPETLQLYQGAADAYRKAMEHCEQGNFPNDEFHENMANLSQVLANTHHSFAMRHADPSIKDKHFEAALSAYNTALEHEQKILPVNDTNLAEIFCDCAWTQLERAKKSGQATHPAFEKCALSLEQAKHHAKKIENEDERSSQMESIDEHYYNLFNLLQEKFRPELFATQPACVTWWENVCRNEDLEQGRLHLLISMTRGAFNSANRQLFISGMQHLAPNESQDIVRHFQSPPETPDPNEAPDSKFHNRLFDLLIYDCTEREDNGRTLLKAVAKMPPNVLQETFQKLPDKDSKFFSDAFHEFGRDIADIYTQRQNAARPTGQRPPPRSGGYGR